MVSLKGIDFSKGDVVKIDGEVLIYHGTTYPGEECGFASHKFWNENYTSISYLGLNNKVESFEWVKRPTYESLASHFGTTVEDVANMFTPEKIKKVWESVAEDMSKKHGW